MDSVFYNNFIGTERYQKFMNFWQSRSISDSKEDYLLNCHVDPKSNNDEDEEKECLEPIVVNDPMFLIVLGMSSTGNYY